jgi:hypothetical protein
MKRIFFLATFASLIACNQQDLPLYEATKSSSQASKPTTPNPPAGTTSNAVGLKIHPENSHYFQDVATGEPVMIAAYYNIVPTSTGNDYNNDLNELKNHSGRYARIWHLLPWDSQPHFWPWARSVITGAPMGGNKIDFNTWDATYWSRMNDALSKATNSKITSEIMLFDRCGMSPADPTRWGGNPWASNNNINNLETPLANSDGTPEFYQYASKPNLRLQQERYIMKMIDETVKYNVIFEIENEHWKANDPDFADHYGQFIKNYMRNKYPTTTRLVSYNSLMDDIETFYTRSSIDIVNKHYGGEPEARPALLNEYVTGRWNYNKAINIDEFANGVTDTNILREECWSIITGGGNFHIEDADPASNPWGVVDNIRQFKEQSHWDFVHSGPNNSVAPSAYCMIHVGSEYVCYFPAGGTKTIDLPAGKYRAQWWDPRAGGFSNIETFQHTSGVHNLNSPTNKDWVLHVIKN